MNDLQTGIFIPQEVLAERLRILEKVAQCTTEQATGMIVSLWLTFARIADDKGAASLEAIEQEEWLTNEKLEWFELSGLIRVPMARETPTAEDTITLIDFDAVVSPARRLKEHDDKLEKKRHLDMIRKQKRRAELKATAIKPPDKPVEPSIPQPEPAQEEPAAQADSLSPEPQTEPKAKKPKKKPVEKKPVEKKQFGEFVSMTDEEYQRLVEEFGEAAANVMVEMLDNYKGSSGKKYKSDYRAILTWVVDRVRERNPGLIQRKKTVSAAAASDNPFDDDNPF